MSTADHTAVRTAWFLRPASRNVVAAEDAPRLFCFPCAGHGAAMYRGWQGAFGAGIDVWPVQPPGRGTRLREAPLNRVPALVESILPALLPHLDRPYALFGHSFGAAVAAFVALALAERGAPAPACLFLSSRHPPNVPSPVPPLGRLADHDFVRTIHARYGGIPRKVMDEPDLMAMLLPALRADIQALEALDGAGPHPLPAPVVAFGGDRDPLVSADSLDGWRDWAPHGYRRRLLPGGHFYLEAEAGPLVEEIRSAFLARAREPSP